MNDSWPAVEIESVDQLDECIRELDLHRSELAWRGLSRAEWSLRSSFDRIIRDHKPEVPYRELVAIEREALERFRRGALSFATDTERQFLQTPLGPGIWDIMALGRHNGLPTRLLDWTRSLWIAAYFACIDDLDSDGALWWFHQHEFEDAIRDCWDRWGVPKHVDDPYFSGLSQEIAGRMGLNERALHARAFDDPGAPWITKVHFRMTFPRMEAQQGFMTACGTLRTDHERAIDALPNAESITRGRIIVSSSAKAQIVQRLMTYNLDARSLLYPGLDLVARQVRDRIDFHLYDLASHE